MFLQVVKELYRKEINGNKILIPTQDVKNLPFWTGAPNFPYICQNIL